MAKMTEEPRATVILNGLQANATLKEIEASAWALNAELKGLKTNTQEFADKSKKLQELNTNDCKNIGRAGSPEHPGLSDTGHQY
ncbi:MAG: hypothetical protein NTX61_00130 [Bacteroidetes bacterium]|nr:hypothetical protein [Bacteroidota bacterium]